MTDSYTTLRFHALDTWFFREARPFDTLGSPELSSHFPPPAPTVAGAIKTLIGRQAGIDWNEFTPKTGGEPRHELYGRLGDLRLRGPFLCRNGDPLFPAPLFLLKDKDGEYRRLAIGDPVETDLGKVRLPCFKPGDRDRSCKPLENAWLTPVGLRAVLDGGEPAPEDMLPADELFAHESRLGIGCDNRTSTVRAEDALLYQTRHVRPRDDVGLVVGVAGLPSDARPEPVRLGGEGRLALLEAGGPDPLDSLPAPELGDDTHGLILVLLTPADLNDCWRLPNSTPDAPAERDSGKAKVWHCEIHGVKLAIHSAVLGKPRREGGWHLAEGKPRRVDSFVPAGSAWYCTVADDTPLPEAIKALHLKQIGDGQRLGRGLLAVGLWPGDENLPGAQS
jgi:CRISPR-associated protein Cmr3